MSMPRMPKTSPQGPQGPQAPPPAADPGAGSPTVEAPAGGSRLSRLWPLALIVLGLGLFFAFDLDRFIGFDVLREHRNELIAWRDGNFALAALVFVLAYILAVAFSIPGAIWFTIGGGFLFGPFVGTLLVIAGATAGASLLFLAARYAVAGWCRAKTGPWLARLEQGFRDNALSYLLFLRLMPLFPFWLVNLVPAVLGVPLTTFIVATAIGIVPGTFVYALVGNGVGEIIDEGAAPDLGVIFEPAILAPLVGLALLALLPVAWRWWRSR